MKNKILKSLSGLTAVLLMSHSFMLSADAFYVDVEDKEVPIDVEWEEGNPDFYLKYNIFPNPYHVLPEPDENYQAVYEDTGDYKYYTNYSYGTYIIKPDVYPCETGWYFKIQNNNNSFLEIPLDAEYIPQAEAFIEADDRIGLYEFLLKFNGHEADSNSYTLFEYFSTDKNGNCIYYENDDAYRSIINKFVYPHFTQGDPISGGGEPIVTPPTPTFGDLNMDGNVSLFDIIMVNKMVIGAIKAQNVQQFEAADVDRSYILDMDDVNLIVKYAVDLIDTFPVENNN